MSWNFTVFGRCGGEPGFSLLSHMVTLPPIALLPRHHLPTSLKDRANYLLLHAAFQYQSPLDSLLEDGVPICFVFWPFHMWHLSSLTRDQSNSQFLNCECGVLTTGSPGKSKGVPIWTSKVPYKLSHCIIHPVIWIFSIDLLIFLIIFSQALC